MLSLFTHGVSVQYEVGEMPTETEWYLEKRVIISRARGEITLDEFTSMGKVLDEYRQEGQLLSIGF